LPLDPSCPLLRARSPIPGAQLSELAAPRPGTEYFDIDEIGLEVSMRKALMVGALLAAGVAAVVAQGGLSALRGTAEDLAARAEVQESEARAVALRAVPGGRIVEVELEDEAGRLIYSIELEAESGVEEVEVDALTGELIGIEHEDDDDDDDSDDDGGDRDDARR
jgi:uncharacterized membrane protein YkoI